MNKIYAGIGSRKTPEHILKRMENIGAWLASLGYTLRSGGAQGADQAFEKGCDIFDGEKDILLAGDAIKSSSDWAYSEARKYIPDNRPPFDSWKPYTRGLIVRNMMQILGRNGNEPADFVICWTPASLVDGGGTGYAIRCAVAHGIPVYNLKDPNVEMMIF